MSPGFQRNRIVSTKAKAQHSSKQKRLPPLATLCEHEHPGSLPCRYAGDCQVEVPSHVFVHLEPHAVAQQDGRQDSGRGYRKG